MVHCPRYALFRKPVLYFSALGVRSSSCERLFMAAPSCAYCPWTVPSSPNSPLNSAQEWEDAPGLLLGKSEMTRIRRQAGGKYWDRFGRAQVPINRIIGQVPY